MINILFPFFQQNKEQLIKDPSETTRKNEILETELTIAKEQIKQLTGNERPKTKL